MLITKKIYDAYVALLHHELVPALGCTEPIAIALAAAKAREVLGEFPDSITVSCSGNIVKNVKSVIVPNSGGLQGIDVAATLGAVGGISEKQLEVLSEITPEHQRITKDLVTTDFCHVKLADGVENLFISMIAKKGKHTSLVEIHGSHTNITKVMRDDITLFDVPIGESDEGHIPAYKNMLETHAIYEFARKVRIQDVQNVIERQIKLNTTIADEGLRGDYGIGVGKTMLKYYQYSDVRVRACARAAAGSDARMGGCSLPVVINSGSGNQGMTVSLPVIEYAKELKTSQETLIRALVLANLIAFLQKRYIGNLSAFCGAVCAATGAASGIAFLYGWQI